MFDIRKARETDLEDVCRIARAAFSAAFGDSEGDMVAELIENILNDRTALPRLSLVAIQQGVLVGHILFSKAIIEGASSTLSASLLTPLGVVPKAQSTGIGSRLIDEGLRHLRQTGVEIVFVLGHPEYYPRHGFVPALPLGLEAPYPIPKKYAEAWMVQALHQNILDDLSGKVRCCDALDQGRYWLP